MKKNSNLLFIAVPILIVLLAATVYQYGFLSVRTELSERAETVSVKSKLLNKYMSLIADKPRIEQTLANLKETRKTQNLKMFEGQTASVAAATLQSTVKEILLSRGGTIASERVEKPEDAGKFKVITVTIDAVLPDTRTLSDTLYTIETQTPYLVVRELDARIRNFNQPRDLTVKLKVSGLTGGM